jgi:hypothetical protein
MKNLFLSTILLFTLFAPSKSGFTQSPNLGVTSSFTLFKAAGAFTNNGTSIVTGDVGTHVGAFTGFPPGIVAGQIQVANTVSAQAATDVGIAYADLIAVTCGSVLGTTLGNGAVLNPGVYFTGGASTLNGNVVLNGLGNPNALFIFKIDGAFSTSTLSNVILTNSAKLSNVYWQVNGAFNLANGSVFQGTVIANGAITLLDGASLYGRGLSVAGTIILNNNMVSIVAAAPLPIHLAGIYAVNKGHTVSIAWEAKTETVGALFQIERLAGNGTFLPIGKVVANGSNGKYAFVDHFPKAGINQYRLKMVELDGTYSFSAVVMARVNTVVYNKIAVYPNPAYDNVFIKINGEIEKNATITIYDVYGSKIRTKTVSSVNISENIQQLPPGIYFVHYTDQNTRQTIKMSKQ